MNPKHGDFPGNPEEFKKQLEDFMRRSFPGGNLNAGFGAAANPEPPSGEGEKQPPKNPDEGFRFDHKPREVKAHLDRYVIRQEEAKKVLSVALCDHYHHVRHARTGRSSSAYAKQNVLLLGPTGVGKTYLIRSVADLIGVPFVKADATKFSETGYVGADVEDLVRDLVRLADGDVERAQYGIIFIDEIDKIAASTGSAGRDVSGRGVQTNLLKLMEETEVPARAPHDIAGQIQAMMDVSQRNKKPASSINTRHILFVVSGAFDGLEEITRKRLRESTVGFAAQQGVDGTSADRFSETATRDFIEYGFEPEFIGRLPVRVVCLPLEVDDLYQILKTSEGSIIRQYEQSFGAYGIDVLFQDDGMRRIAELAAEEKTGARGLMTVCEKVFRELKYELPSTHVKRFEVTAALVDDPVGGLRRLLAENAREERDFLERLVEEFGERFAEAHGLKIEFESEASRKLVDEAQAAGLSVRDLCAERFKDYQFGLRLIEQNTGQKVFRIPADAVAAPDRFLSEWVVRSYKKSGNDAERGGAGA